MRLIILLLSCCLACSAQTSKLKFSKLTDHLYIYTTHKLFSGTPFPSNSMYMVTADGIVLIDTPWDEAQFQPLLDSIEARHNKKVLMCIATHFHDDRTAGLTYYQSKGIPTYTSKLTYDLSREKGEGLAEHYFVNDTVFRAGGKTIEVFYPGEGHTKDNVVVWFKEDKVLYGGCLVKSTKNNSLGNIADANIPAWSSTIQNVIDRFPKPAYVVPGHFGWSRGRKALRHTLSLLRQHKQ